MLKTYIEAAGLARCSPRPRRAVIGAAMTVGARMKSRNVLVASAVAIMMLAAGCSAGSAGSGESAGSGGSGGGTANLKLEKTDIVVNAFPAIDSAGLYIAQMDGLFAQQGLHVKV